MNRKPKVVLTLRDVERLEKLIEMQGRNASHGLVKLQNELDRAELLESNDISPSAVTMNSTVRFKIEALEEEFQLTLTCPKDVDSNGKTISILTPVGCALLGLSEGDEIEWPNPDGELLRIKVNQVVYQPERSGDYHR